MGEMPNSCYYTKLGPTRVAIADLCDYYDKGWMLTRINVPAEFRGTGEGTRLLKRILADADAHQVTLWLEISPSGGLGYDHLEAWYKRHGFKWFRGMMGVMRRKPTPLPEPRMRHVVEVWCNDCHQQISETVVDDNVETKLRAICKDESCDRGAISVKIIAQAPLDEPEKPVLKLTGNMTSGPEYEARDIHSDLLEDR